VDKTGRRLGAENLKVTVIREHREYYWEYTNGAWEWRSTSQFYPEDRYSVDIPDQESIVVDVPVKWGGYRLEIFDQATGLTASHDIWAGWQPRGSEARDLNRPDRVDLVLDKKAYAPEDRVQVTVKSPEGGSGYLFVESDTNLLTRPITVSPEGTDIFFDLDPAWQRHDLYVSAVVVRPGESRSSSLPKRAVGLVHLPLDRRHRHLSVDIQMPAKTEPGRRFTVPVQVRRPDGTIPSGARITLAAVDTGILNLTGYDTPAPFDYFFQPRQYGPEIHDMYQKLIETGDGGWARQRFGGDAPTLSRGGDRPATDVQIISIHRAAVAADADGMALFPLDMPEFNGQVRLMAVAHTAADFGSGDHELTLASPLVTQMTMPRFLAAGDQARLHLDLHNLSGTTQEISLAFTAGLPLEIQGQADRHLHLAPDEKKSVSVPVTAETAPGRSDITCTIQGLLIDGEHRTLERSWFLETRPPYPAATTAWHKTLAPGESFATDPARNMIFDTMALRASLGSAPPIPVAEHVRTLDAYPYGCLEQTVSSLFPHVILGSADMAELGIRAVSDDTVYDKIRRGIQLVGEKQKTTGGFGLWDHSGPENAWLTAYAVHFLILAVQAGYAVPEQSLQQALDRLLVFVRRPGAIPVERYYPPGPYRASVQAYAAFVLAMGRSLTLGDARAAFQAAQNQIQGSLAFVHAGVALHLAGDMLLAEHAFDRALQTRRPENGFLGDFGSDLRDLAAAFYLISMHAPEYRNRNGFLTALEPMVSEQKWFSTQERSAMVMAGAARLKTPQKRWRARVLDNGIPRDLDHTSQKEVAWSGDRAGREVKITNTGQTDLFVHVVRSGYPDQAPDPESSGVTVTRRYLDMNGHPVSLEKATMGDRILVELAVKADQDMPHCLVVDLLPAGMALEDPHLSGSFVIDGIMVDEKPVADWHKAHGTRHTEYRDDRFAAALDLRAEQEYRRFYGVRLVHPGRFQVPPPLVEDMYKPWIRAIGSGRGILAIPDF
jgi:alpha-2-macroglobulin